MTENPASAEPVLPLRWCVSPDSLAQLSAENAVHLHLLISVQNNGREVLRRCVPLEQAMEYLELNHAGLNKVNAVIIWNRRDDPRQLQHEAMRSSRPYNWEGTFDPSELDIDGVRVVKDGTANIDVNVPDEFFAHEPPEWERRWVNFLFENEPKDQCAYRRRRLLAYSIQLPIVVLLAIFITMLRIVYALLTIFMGVRGLNPEPILHPFRDSTEEIWVNPDFFPLSGVDAWLSERNNFFVADADGRKRPFGFVRPRPSWVLDALSLPHGTIRYYDDEGPSRK